MRSKVLRRSFWHISDVLLVVQEWSPKAASNRPVLLALPIWVDLKNVLDNLFSYKGLKFLGDLIGITQKLHPSTERFLRLDVARVLILANLEKALPKKICLQGTDTVIQVSYPWFPPLCTICNTWGHIEADCRKEKSISNQNEEHIEGKRVEVEVDRRVQNEPEIAAKGSDINVAQGEPVISSESEQVVMNVSGDKELDSWTVVGKQGTSSPVGKSSSSKPPIDDESVLQGQVSPSRFQVLSDIQKETEEGKIEKDIRVGYSAEADQLMTDKVTDGSSRIIPARSSRTRSKLGAATRDQSENASNFKNSRASAKRH